MYVYHIVITLLLIHARTHTHTHTHTHARTHARTHACHLTYAENFYDTWKLLMAIFGCLFACYESSFVGSVGDGGQMLIQGMR